MKNLWGGRFSGGVDPQAWEYNASIGFDIRLVRGGYQGFCIAWAMALGKSQRDLFHRKGPDHSKDWKKYILNSTKTNLKYSPPMKISILLWSAA